MCDFALVSAKSQNLIRCHQIGMYKKNVFFHVSCSALLQTKLMETSIVFTTSVDSTKQRPFAGLLSHERLRDESVLLTIKK
jgi:hypothetical protein